MYLAKSFNQSWVSGGPRVACIILGSIFTYLSSAQCWSTVQWFGTTVFLRLSAKVWKLYSFEPSVLSILLPLACHIFSHWAMPKFHLFTLVVKILISGFLVLSQTLPLAFFPCYLHKEIALLLLDYDLQLYILGQLPGQNVLHLQFSIFF